MFDKRFSIITLIFLSLILIIPAYQNSDASNAAVNQSFPSLIVHNGTIVTMDISLSEVEAFAVQGDKIFAVGSDSAILGLAGPDTTYIDLEGKTVLPGFIDSHAHWIGDRGLAGIGSADEAIELALRNGWTSISELFVNEDRLNELRALVSINDLPIRVNAYLPLSWQYDRFGSWYQSFTPRHEYSLHLRIGGVKIFMDRWIGNYTELYFNDSELFNLVLEAHNLGFQVAIHSASENATDIVLDVFEDILNGTSNDKHRFRIEHIVELRDDQILRLKDLGIISSFQFTWFNSDAHGDLNSVSDFTPEDYLLVTRWRDLLDSGAIAMGSTDFPWSDGPINSSLEAIYRVVTRIGQFGSTPLPWMLNQTITVEQALKLITIDAAYGTFQEHAKGSIENGKLADYIILSDNPLTTPLSSFLDINILSTIIGGSSEYCASGYETLCSPTTISTSYPSSSTSFTSLVPVSSISTSISITTSSLNVGIFFFIALSIVVAKRKFK